MPIRHESRGLAGAGARPAGGDHRSICDLYATPRGAVSNSYGVPASNGGAAMGGDAGLTVMADLVFLGVGIIGFASMLAYVHLCERL